MPYQTWHFALIRLQSFVVIFNKEIITQIGHFGVDHQAYHISQSFGCFSKFAEQPFFWLARLKTNLLLIIFSLFFFSDPETMFCLGTLVCISLCHIPDASFGFLWCTIWLVLYKIDHTFKSFLRNDWPLLCLLCSHLNLISNVNNIIFLYYTNLYIDI